MATMRVDPRPTPAERADERIEVDVDEALTVLAATLEDWAAPRQQWELQLRDNAAASGVALDDETVRAVEAVLAPM